MEDTESPRKIRHQAFSKLVSTFAFESPKSTAAARAPVTAVISKRRREESEDGEKEKKRSPKVRKIHDISYLPPLEDRLVKYLDVIFCGCNPGHTSAKIGYHYGNTQNAFWRCLNRSGFTETVLSPEQGPFLPERYNIGLTDLVSTPSHAFSDISSQERKQSVITLLQKVAFYKPRILALNSFTIWSDIASQLGKRDALRGVKLKAPVGRPTPSLKLERLEEHRRPEFIPWKLVYSVEEDEYEHPVRETLIIPLPGTSGANAGYSLAEKVAFFAAVHDTIPLIKQGTFNTAHMGEIRVDLTGFTIQ